MELPIPVACAAALVLLATGCGGGTVSEPAPAISMPPPPTVRESPLRAETGGPGSAEAAPGSAAVPDPADSCVLVAGGVSSLLLAPMSLRSHSDPAALASLRDQILDVRGKVPGELHGDFTVLAAAVEVPPQGSGKFDEPRFREAMKPLQDWLTARCSKQASG